MTARPLPADLVRRIDASGYFPELIADAVAMAVGSEVLVAHLVHLEATFNSDEVHRHVTVLALTPSRLVISHTDDAGEAGTGAGQAITSTESVSLAQISSVTLTQVLARPEAHGRRESHVTETWLTLGWGSVRRVDVEPAQCSDPTCEADHGYSGTLVGDDLTIRMSPAADGADTVAQLISFATAVQHATGRTL